MILLHKKNRKFKSFKIINFQKITNIGIKFLFDNQFDLIKLNIVRLRTTNKLLKTISILYKLEDLTFDNYESN
jgi:hypothetical protein